MKKVGYYYSSAVFTDRTWQFLYYKMTTITRQQNYQLPARNMQLNMSNIYKYNCHHATTLLHFQLKRTFTNWQWIQYLIKSQENGVYQEGTELLDISPAIPCLSCAFQFFITSLLGVEPFMCFTQQF